MTKHHYFRIAFLLLIILLAHGYSVFAAPAGEPGDANVTISVSSTWIKAGDPVRVSWSNKRGESCVGNGFDTSGRSDGGVAAYPASDTIFTVTCGQFSASSDRVKVTQNGPPPPMTASLTSNPVSVVRGNSAALSWSSNGDSCTGYNFDTGNKPSGTVPVNPGAGDGYYSITCGRAEDSATKGASITIPVTDPEFDASCRPDKTSALTGETVSWFASATDGTRPYTFDWFGQAVTNMHGPSISVAYDSDGQKSASITATDSSTVGAGMSVQKYGDTRCTGSLVASDVDSDTEDPDNGNSQTSADMVGIAGHMATSQFYLNNNLAANPQNYCSETRMKGPSCTSMACYYTFSTSIYATNGTRPTQSADFSNGKASYYVAALGTINQGVHKTAERTCSASVTVTAATPPTPPTTPTTTPPTLLPSATLTANPISIIKGDSSTLTWSSTNATTCTSPDFATGGAVSGSAPVSPSSDTTYHLTCTGAGGTASDTADVAVTPQLSASCTVNPTSTATGEPVTWTVSAAGGIGNYTYAWSGDDGVTGTGTGTSVTKTYATTGAKHASVIVTSGGKTAPAACPTIVIDTAARPDLSAGAITPTAATVDAAITLSAPIRNSGSAGTSAGFTDLFQRATDANGANATDIGTYANASLVAGGSSTATRPYSFSAVGTYYVRACADKNAAGNNGMIDESDETNNCGPWTAINVVEEGAPDLTAGPTSGPPSANIGAAVTFTSTMTNIGSAPAGSAPILFQVQTPEQLKDSPYLPSLAPGASAPGSVAFTFDAAGTYQIRACANFNTSWTGIVPESNFGNNCGDWTSITIGTNIPTTPTGLSYSCNANGTQATLRWNPSANASFYWVRVWDSGTCPSGWMHPQSNAAICIPNPDMVRSTSVAYATAPGVNHSWAVGASNGQPYPQGASGNGDGSFTCNAASGGLSCTVDTPQPMVGGTVTYTAHPTGGTTNPYTWDDQQGAVQTTGGTTFSRTVTDASPKIMIVKGANAAGPATCPVVTASCTNPKADISASPLRVRAEQDPVTITWTASGINGTCTISADNVVIQTVSANACTVPSGSLQRTLKTQTTFRINCDNGRATDQVVVNVIPKFIEF